jgi:diaminohydroxyphosphoribosylaminopyrimidine deaminase/5-amino-6-(5-phosphoribosylamino)uracil reductase
LIGPGKRSIPTINSGTNLDIQFSNSDVRTINIRWSTLQPQHGVVDLLSENGAVRIASGTINF